jgi:predicted GNAT superfamily acetyltransferase
MYLRDLKTLDDCRRVVELEKRVWGYTDAEDVVPAPVLIVTIKRGGVLIGAFDDRDCMVGFVYSLPGIKDGTLLQWSHMLGVLDEHRGSGVGHRLKLEQRLRTLQLGMDLIEWTYDPLQALNAHLNFRKLGIVVDEYEENIYGESSSPLHRGSPTDRFVAEWWIRTPRVSRRIAGAQEDGAPDMTSVVTLNETRARGEWLECARVDLDVDAPKLGVAIPTGFTGMQAKDPGLAQAWRMATRELFETYFGRGYHATDFVLERDRGRGRYLLERRPRGI